MFVAASEDEVVGVAALVVILLIAESSALGRLTALAVHPQMRGTGIGLSLVARAEAAAIILGCSLMEVTTGTWRADALAFFERVGFTEWLRRLSKSERWSNPLIGSSNAGSGYVPLDVLRWSLEKSGDVTGASGFLIDRLSIGGSQTMGLDLARAMAAHDHQISCSAHPVCSRVLSLEKYGGVLPTAEDGFGHLGAHVGDRLLPTRHRACVQTLHEPRGIHRCSLDEWCAHDPDPGSARVHTRLGRPRFRLLRLPDSWPDNSRPDIRPVILMQPPLDTSLISPGFPVSEARHFRRMWGIGPDDLQISMVTRLSGMKLEGVLSTIEAVNASGRGVGGFASCSLGEVPEIHRSTFRGPCECDERYRDRGADR